MPLNIIFSITKKPHICALTFDALHSEQVYHSDFQS